MFMTPVQYAQHFLNEADAGDGPVDVAAIIKANGIHVLYAEFDDQAKVAAYTDVDPLRIVVNKNMSAEDKQYAMALEFARNIFTPEIVRDDNAYTALLQSHVKVGHPQGALKDACDFACALIAPADSVDRLKEIATPEEMRTIFIAPAWMILRQGAKGRAHV